jgi:hypothetical protein
MMDENYRDDNYRDSYREDYRENYRDYRNYRDNYRDEYGRNQRNMRNYRNYRDRYGRNYRSQEDYYACLEDVVEDGMELARAYEDVSEMATNSKDKQMLTKIAEREKEHYRTVKEMLEKGM